jgi:hypothetical protein
MVVEPGNVSFSFATLIGAASGFGGLAVGWGMHRQALKDLAQKFDSHQKEADQRDKQIGLVTTNLATLTEVSRGNSEQIKMLHEIVMRMASFPRGSMTGTWESGPK